MPLLCAQWKTPNDGQKNCPKHIEFYSKNKFEKLVHPVGFIIRIYHEARSRECQKAGFTLHESSCGWLTPQTVQENHCCAVVEKDLVIWVILLNVIAELFIVT